MAHSIALRCPWCKSKDQTMDIIGVLNGTEAPKYMHSTLGSAHYLSLKCRSCQAFSSATVAFNANQNVNIPGIIRSSSASYDFTKYLSDVIAQCPKPDNAVSELVPVTVRDALFDAYDATRARARCTHFRSAVEFSVRNIGIEVSAGDTLGAILGKASKTYALPQPLIDLCDQVKAFGNWGLHWAELDIEEKDADAAQTITEAIVSYLFELPALVSAAADRTAEAKAAHHAA